MHRDYNNYNFCIQDIPAGLVFHLQWRLGLSGCSAHVSGFPITNSVT